MKDKMDELNGYLSDLEEITPDNLDSYIGDKKTKAACERYFEKIVEAAVDLAFLVIKEEEFNLPDDDKRAFDILEENKIIDEKLCSKLKDAKGMRNILAHEYGEVDDEVVFNSIENEVVRDFKLFIEEIEKFYEGNIEGRKNE